MDPIYGGYLHGCGLVQQRRRDAREIKLDRLHRLIGTKSGPQVNCQSDNCKTITIVVEVADPYAEFPFNYVGHTGISIENSYYDLGPNYDMQHPKIKFDGFAGGVEPWWSAPEMWEMSGLNNIHEKYDPANFEALKENMFHFATAPTILITFCTCSEKAKKIEQYWKNLFQSMKDEKSPSYAFTGFNCSTSVWKSVGINSGNKIAPESLLENDWMLSQLKHECGLYKGQAAHIKLEYSAFK